MIKNKIYYSSIIGVAGYVAPRHLQAMKENNFCLLSATDKSDSVGILDNYFPEASFFLNYESFKKSLRNDKLNYLSVCSPNYLHKKHIIDGLNSNLDVISEKPLVLNMRSIDEISKIENKQGKKVFTIMQLRYHPQVLKLKEIVSKSKNKIFDVEITYVTSRGKWFYSSWKNDLRKSGGIVTNIGIHLFDFLLMIFGQIEKNNVHIINSDIASGFLQLKNANVKWFLSTNYMYLPDSYKKKNIRTFRQMIVDGDEFEFSKSFNNLHSLSYNKIINGLGFEIKEVSKAVNLTSTIRNSKIKSLSNDFHKKCLEVI